MIETKQQFIDTIKQFLSLNITKLCLLSFC